MAARLSRSQVHFLSLPTAIFCVQCELIGANTTPACLACGSKAVLSLSRLFGGSLRAQPLARVIEDDELSRIVRDLLYTVPGEDIIVPDFSETEPAAENYYVRPSHSETDLYSSVERPKFDVEP